MFTESTAPYDAFCDSHEVYYQQTKSCPRCVENARSAVLNLWYDREKMRAYLASLTPQQARDEFLALEIITEPNLRLSSHWKLQRGRKKGKALELRLRDLTAPTDGMVSMLGTMGDSKLAQLWRVPIQAVRAWRTERNVEPWKARSYKDNHPGIEKDLATDQTLQAIGDKYGISRERVRQLRDKHGYPSGRAARRERRRAEIHGLLDGLAGTVSDSDAASQTGLSVGDVAAYRKERGISAFAVYAEEKERARDSLGQMSDYQIEEVFGLPHNHAGQERKRLGIAAFAGPERKHRPHKRIDTDRFRELYMQTDPRLTYREIKRVLDLAHSNQCVWLAKRLGLPPRVPGAPRKKD